MEGEALEERVSFAVTLEEGVEWLDEVSVWLPREEPDMEGEEVEVFVVADETEKDALGVFDFEGAPE